MTTFTETEDTHLLKEGTLAEVWCFDLTNIIKTTRDINKTTCPICIEHYHEINAMMQKHGKVLHQFYNGQRPKS